METKAVKTARPDPRPMMGKEEDPRERAARRAAEVRGHLGGMDDGVDEFADAWKRAASDAFFGKVGNPRSTRLSHELDVGVK